MGEESTPQGGDNGVLHEHQRLSPSRVSRFYTTRKRGPEWRRVDRVVHRCAKTNAVVFDKEVDKRSREDDELWAAKCDRQYGLETTLFYRGEAIVAIYARRRGRQRRRKR